MKHLGIGLSILAVAVLAGCGGGGGSSAVPPSSPGAPQQPGYAYRWSYTGGLAPAGSTLQSSQRRVMSTATSPIIVVEPETNAPVPGLEFGYGGSVDSTALVQVDVSPAPAATPTWQAISQVNLASPAPAPSPTATPSPGTFDTVVFATSGSSVQGSLNLIAGTAQSSKTVVVLPRVTVGCSSLSPTQLGVASQEYVGGVKFVNGAAVAETDPANSDLYISGPSCYGNFQSSESGNTLHYPGGGVFLSNTTPFDQVLTTQWSATQTSNTTASMTDGTSPLGGLLIIRTTETTPHIVAIDFRFLQAGGPNRGDGQFSGGFKECGVSVLGC